MAVKSVDVANADRMMARVEVAEAGLDVAFVDGRHGLVPFTEIPEIGKLSNLDSIELPNPYEIHLKSNGGETAELPWDFVRHFCHPGYREKVEQVAAAGRRSFGNRLRALRESRNFTQQQLADAAGIGRITLVRIEGGQRSPRYETLVRLANALEIQPAELMA